METLTSIATVIGAGIMIIIAGSLLMLLGSALSGGLDYSGERGELRRRLYDLEERVNPPRKRKGS